VDSIVSAFAYQIYRHSKGDFNYKAIRCDETNDLTKWLFKKFNTEIPPLITNISNQQVVLVDHTDPQQRADGWESADIIEVLDHHKLNLETSIPPKITIRPYGSTSTLIAQKFLETSTNIKMELAGLMLGAILDDTLALRSPITTETDKVCAGKLSSISGLNDVSSFARELFSEKDKWKKMKAEDIIDSDTKSYLINGVSVQISQVETMDNQLLANSKGEKIHEILELQNNKDKKDLRIVMLTDLIRNDCILYAVGEKKELIEKIFNVKPSNEMYFILPGVLSRKRQVEAPLIQYLSK
ncbi:DHH family phosphoesterase, partial [bacterium]|nr:DHH family phosphoesterase [bacterium]